MIFTPTNAMSGGEIFYEIWPINTSDPESVYTLFYWPSSVQPLWFLSNGLGVTLYKCTAGSLATDMMGLIGSTLQNATTGNNTDVIVGWTPCPANYTTPETSATHVTPAPPTIGNISTPLATKSSASSSVGLVITVCTFAVIIVVIIAYFAYEKWRSSRRLAVDSLWRNTTLFEGDTSSLYNTRSASNVGPVHRTTSLVCPAIPGLNTAYFDREAAFPTVMISYQSNSTGGGLGKSFMWGMANSLKDRGITSFNGYMVKGGQMWQKVWFGLLPEAKCVVLMMSKSFFQSRACIDELEAAIAQRTPIIPVFLERVDISGHFLGESESAVLSANFIRSHIGNVIPPPDRGLFQTPTADIQFDREHWESNMELVVDRIREFCDVSLIKPSDVPRTAGHRGTKVGDLEVPLLEGSMSL
jgi:hypothetical protein